MEYPVEISGNAIKKAMCLIVQEVAGVKEVKDITYIEKSGSFIVSVSVSMQLGTIVPNCAKAVQIHLMAALKDLLNVEATQVNVAVKSII